MIFIMELLWKCIIFGFLDLINRFIPVSLLLNDEFGLVHILITEVTEATKMINVILLL
jgi:hypothetical protein